MPLPNAGDDSFLPQEEPLLPSDLIETITELTSGPEASSAAPPTEGTTPSSMPGAGDQAPPEFDLRHREEFEGLLHLGALTHEFQWAGHRFKIRTMTVGDYLEVGLAQAAWRGSMGENRAYVTAMVAASLVLVDGRSLPLPISNAVGDTEFANKFSYIREHWFPWTVDAIYQETLKLEARATEIIESMGKALPSARSTRG